MKLLLRICSIVLFLAVFAYAGETVRDFSFKTIDGKTIEYRAANKIPMVVNIGAHW